MPITKDKNNGMPFNIYDRLRKIIVEHEQATGIAITRVSMQWFDVAGGHFELGKIEINSQKY